MESQNTGAGLSVGLLSLVAGLILGGIGGYLIGSYAGTQPADEQAATAQEGANSPSASVNAFGDVETNPLEGVRFNPFE